MGNIETKENSHDIKVCSFNIGYNIMRNVVEGSEASMVKICQSVYPDIEKWKIKQFPNLPKCTLNAIELLSGYDIFAVQEIDSSHMEEFKNAIKLSSKGRDLSSNYKFTSLKYGKDKKCSLMIGHNETITGPGHVISPDQFYLEHEGDKRGIQSIYFENLRMLVFNLHAPHGINLFDSIEEKGRVIQYIIENVRLRASIPIDIILVMGDFNDHDNVIPYNDLIIMNQRITLPMEYFIPRTCCADTDYSHTGDYIMTNKLSYISKFGIPIEYDREETPMSDHEPIEMHLNIPISQTSLDDKKNT